MPKEKPSSEMQSMSFLKMFFFLSEAVIRWFWLFIEHQICVL